MGGALRGKVTMNNFDESTGLHWYRRLNAAPGDIYVAKALEFSCLIAAELDIAKPVIYWFEKVALAEAEAGWMQAEDKQAGPWTDPVQHASPFFRLSDPEATDHVGFAPFRADGHFLIQIGFPIDVTLRAIADECYHLYQDVREGPVWREQDENYEFAEIQAAEFANSKDKAIADFLAMS
jgi:hypothetical protein